MTILELVDKYNIDLQKQGDLYVGFCPFHDDKTRPNFTVYQKTNSYFCYTCGIGGDAIDFLSRIEKISRAVAQHRLEGDLQSLIAKLNKVEEEENYVSNTSLQVSKLIHDFLVEHPEMLSKVVEVMSDIDERLVKDVNQQQAVTIIGDVSARLKNLETSCIRK